MPGIYGCAHRGLIGTVKRHQDIRIVVAGGGIAPTGVPEHLPETSPRMHGRPIWSVVDDAILGEKFNDLVVQPVIDAIRILVNKVDYLVFVDELQD